jgi:hypothetical protein
MAGEVPRPSERVPGYPADLEAIVLRALERDPAQRYQTARALELALEDVARDHRMQASSASLGEWMEATFGPKIEPWRQSPAPPPSEASRSDTVKSPDAGGKTKVVAGQAEQNVWVGEAAEIAPVVSTTRKPPVNRWVALGAGLAMVGIAVLAIAWLRPSAASPSLARSDSSGAAPVILAETGKVSFARAGEAPPPAAPTVAPLVPPVPTASAKVSAHVAGSRPARVRSAPPDQDFSRAFARHQPEIRRCFAAPGLAAEFAGELSLRFRVGVDGHVAQVEMIPANAAATPVGTCLLRIAHSTQFARQAEPVTFRIPVSVQVQRDAER